MPLINGKFYMNPAYGRALEDARAGEEASPHNGSSQQGPDSHWVRINGRHVLIQGTQSSGA
jgi:hypothetical protein